jgi:biopolymer transport protein ExbB
MQTGDSSGLLRFIQQADAASFIVIILLLLMSVITWYVMLTKFIQRLRANKLIAQSSDIFWSAPSISAASLNLEQHGGVNSFTRIVRQGIDSTAHYREYIPSEQPGKPDEGVTLSEFVTRALRRAIALETAQLESGLTMLASIAGTAPFIGLFGTVWGIYHALINIGMHGQSTLDAVAGPLGEALIMTAAGLAVAIPAVLGYNALVRSNRMALFHLDSLAYDLHAYLTTGARINGQHFAIRNKVDTLSIKQAGTTQ